MKGKVKIIAGVIVAVILVAVVGGAVMAASPTPTPGTAGWCQAGGGCGGYGFGGDCIDEVSKLTGLTEAEVTSQRQAGKSLVEIAATKSVSEDALIAAIITDRKADLEQLVTDGKITQEQADLMMTQMESRIKVMVENTAACAGGNGNGCAAGGAGFGRQQGRGCGMGGRGGFMGPGNRFGTATK
jgi:hypothetical protein